MLQWDSHFLFHFLSPPRSFGCVAEGADFLKEMKQGGVIVSAKTTEGIENFKKGE